MACLRLLKQPWFHAVRGNHEIMLLNYGYASLKSSPLLQNNDLFLQNGGGWVLRLDEFEQTELWYELLPRLARLPFVISVGDGPGRYHVVHSELMTGHPELSDRFFVQQRTVACWQTADKPKTLARRPVDNLCRAYTGESIAAACIAFFPGSWPI